MRPRWRLEVEGLGKIEHAEVEMRPLTLFVGENNSGKSYLASLLWGLIALQGDLELPEGPELEACRHWVTDAFSRAPVKLSLSEREQDDFKKLFERAVRSGARTLVERTFNSDVVTSAKIAVHAASHYRDLNLEISAASGTTQSVDVNDGHAFIASFTGVPGSEHVLVHILMQLAFWGRSFMLASAAEGFSPRAPLYLPASRTGFMQLYKAAARKSMQRAFRGDVAADRGWLGLTTPAFSFIDMLAFGLTEGMAGRYVDEANLLEAALSGRVELVAGVGVNDYRYLPQGSKIPLSMSLSSSLVTETAPIVLALRHLSGFPVLILEEPEAHLHPKIQRRLAQVIVRLVRKGLHVWITTHSENFCQQINNFMKLGALPPERRAAAQAKLGYGEQDYLELDDVAGYQFELDETGERSTVTELKKLEQGLVMPTFNKELLRLGEEVDFLDQQAAE